MLRRAGCPWALAEAAECVERDFRQFGVERHNLDRCAPQYLLENGHSRGALAGVKHDFCLKHREGGNGQRRGPKYGRFETERVRFVGNQRNDGRRIHDHQVGSPFSS